MRNSLRTAIVAVAALVPVVVATVPAYAESFTFLSRGHTLSAGNNLCNPTGCTDYHLVMQTDGNLVEYGPTLGGGGIDGACWATHTQGHPGAYATYENSGALIVHDETGRSLWSSGTAGKAGTTVNVNDEGDIYVGVTRIFFRGNNPCNG